jgi:hypothetical protein
MRTIENMAETCITTGFFPGCLSGNFVFGNDLKGDVRTGNAISDGLFGSDDKKTASNNNREEEKTRQIIKEQMVKEMMEFYKKEAPENPYEAERYWSAVYDKYPFLRFQNMGILTGCNEQSKKDITTDGENLSWLFDDNMSDNEKLKALMTHIRVTAEGTFEEFLEITKDPNEALRLTLVKMASTLEKNVPVSYKNGHVLNFKNYNKNMPIDQTFSWPTGPDGTPSIDCSGLVSAVLYGLGYPPGLHDKGNSTLGAANIFYNKKIVENIDSSNVKIGDLVFWPGLTHIGIVTGIDNQGRVSSIMHSTPDDTDYDNIRGNTNGLQRTRYPFDNNNDNLSGYYSRWKNRMRFGRLKYNPFWKTF